MQSATDLNVKFSFERYRGSAAKLLKERVREVQVVDPGRVRVHLKARSEERRVGKECRL